MIKIRPADESDRPAILTLARRSQEATGIPVPKAFPPDEFASWLYSARVLERFVATRDGLIVGHGVIEQPNSGDLPLWRSAATPGAKLLELGGAFVDPDLLGQGIWSRLLDNRLARIRRLGAVPVSATWMQNDYVKRTFRSRGATEIATKDTRAGPICLFVFPDSRPALQAYS